MSRGSGRRTVWVLCGVGVGALAVGPLQPAATGAAAATASGVRISGSSFTLDGAPFEARGLTLVGLLSPPGLSNKVGQAAAAHYGQAELDAAKAWNANTIRFPLSQRGMDPQDSLHSGAYDTEVLDGVHLARANGFVVVLSMQTQSIGGGTGHISPSAATVRAWKHLAPMFGSDPGVVYELFNEPPGVDTAANWALWRDGGGSQIGHQQLISTVRATGAVNVLLADGLRYAKSLMGVPLLTDPLGQTGYAFHPYLIKPIDVASAWPAYFGTFAATHPVIATAWGAASQSNYCEAGWPSTSAALVTYLRAHHIGLAGLWGFDIPGTATTGWTWQPNTFTGFRCGVAGHGPGALVQQAYLAGWT